MVHGQDRDRGSGPRCIRTQLADVLVMAVVGIADSAILVTDQSVIDGPSMTTTHQTGPVIPETRVTTAQQTIL